MGKRDKAIVAMEVKGTAMYFLDAFVSKDYARRVWDAIGEDVVEDVWECSGVQAGEMFSDSDVRYAIGRVLCDRLNADEV